MVEMLPFSSQTWTIVIVRSGTVPVMVNGSPRRTSRLPWSLNVGTKLTVAVTISDRDDDTGVTLPVAGVKFAEDWYDKHPENTIR
jgi:hypothetical protein